MKPSILLVACIALFFAGVTASAFSTCPMNTDKATAEMQTGSDMNILCYGTENSQDQNSDRCHDCDCQYCIQTNALPAQELKDHHGGIAVGILSGQFLFSRQIETPFRPPKHLL